jgi:tRNA (guanine-N7-)-methyltransferase
MPVPRGIGIPPMIQKNSNEVLTEVPPDWLTPEAPPLVLDVGSHRGSFLLPLAEQEPHHNILGIEKQNQRVLRTRKKIERLGLKNAWAVQSGGLDAVLAFPAESVAMLHVLFPDPWPKRRHADRRLVNPTFLAASARVLKPGGLLRFVTDDEPYAQSVAAISQTLPTLIPSPVPIDAYPPSGFELTFTGLGKPIHRFAWRKQS